MSALLSLEGTNTESTEGVENAGKQIILVTGSVLGGAVLASQTGNTTEVRFCHYSLHPANWDISAYYNYFTFCR